MKILFLTALIMIFTNINAQSKFVIEYVNKPSNEKTNDFYPSSKEPLQKEYFVKLPITKIQPGGWLRKILELQSEGLAGHLGEISLWLTKKDNAWLNREGKGNYGWEEVPYWLRGYQRIGYVLNKKEMIYETNIWIDSVLKSQRPTGEFGPVVYRKGKRDLWAQMLMLQCLQNHYEFTKDKRVPELMSKYFKWQLSIPDSLFLKDYWENSRAGDNLYSVYWLYNLTGEKYLLDLAEKIDKNAADWRQTDKLPNWHVVNIAECFREPATFYLQNGKRSDLESSYNVFKLARNIYGQVPGGMFGADEDAREGYDDPRQASETCSFVEQINSDRIMLQISGDPLWTENCEDIAFNSLPSTFMPDYRSLRYLTAPNMVLNDDKNHSPGIENAGPYLMMNPFSSRCCQHNHSSAWINFIENLWSATPDNGIAAQIYSECSVSAKVFDGTEISIFEKTKYPFDSKIEFIVSSQKKINFPLYLRIPSWCKDPSVSINGVKIKLSQNVGNYLRIFNEWKNKDKIVLTVPMKVSTRVWEKNKNSMSVNYGPLTFSIKINERYQKKLGLETAQHDSKWQPGVDQSKWPAYEIYPVSDWNYGLVLNKKNILNSFSVVKRKWFGNNIPFTNLNAPIEIIAKGKKIKEWGIDQYGLCAVLPVSPVKSDMQEERIILVPMGGARLRISSFPVIK